MALHRQDRKVYLLVRGAVGKGNALPYLFLLESIKRLLLSVSIYSSKKKGLPISTQPLHWKHE